MIYLAKPKRDFRHAHYPQSTALRAGRWHNAELASNLPNYHLFVYPEFGPEVALNLDDLQALLSIDGEGMLLYGYQVCDECWAEFPTYGEVGKPFQHLFDDIPSYCVELDKAPWTQDRIDLARIINQQVEVL